MSKFAQTTGLPRPKVLLTIQRTQFGNHKLTPQQSSAERQQTDVYRDPTVCWSLALCQCDQLLKVSSSYAQACHQQAEEAFPAPIQRTLLVSLQPHDCVFWKLHQRKTAFNVTGRDLTDHEHSCKISYGALGTHLTAKQGPTWHLVLRRHWGPPDQTDKQRLQTLKCTTLSYSFLYSGIEAESPLHWISLQSLWWASLSKSLLLFLSPTTPFPSGSRGIKEMGGLKPSRVLWAFWVQTPLCVLLVLVCWRRLWSPRPSLCSKEQRR